MRSILLLMSLLAGLAGCEESSSDEGGADEAATTASECEPGHESCPCVLESICMGGLACVDATCVDVADTSGSADGSTGKPTDESGAMTCVETTECGSTEICVDASCIDTDVLYFDVVVQRLEPTSCLEWSGSELYFEYIEGGDYESTSSASGCPSSWPDEPLRYDSLRSFRLNVWEADLVADDFVTVFCAEGDLASGCAPIPKEALHAGTFVGTTADGVFEVELSFAVTP